MAVLYIKINEIDWEEELEWFFLKKNNWGGSRMGLW